MSGDLAGAAGGGVRQQGTAVPLAHLTTLRIGGPARTLVAVDSTAQALQTLEDLDTAGTGYWPLGAGSNMVVSDAGVDSVVVWLRNSRIDVVSHSTPGITVRVEAGTNWDSFVDMCVQRNWSGVEALSGIPGTVGATPVQNVGAYGACVADTISSVHVWDRQRRCERTFTSDDCEFGYRESVFKRTRMPDGSPAYVVLTVEFTLADSSNSSPIRYPELAHALSLRVGETAALGAVRDAVIRLRRSKAMVLDATDHDTWSVGSFFINPVVDATVAAQLPDAAPRWRLPDDDSRVKLSAAWLVEHAGFPRGFRLSSSRAALSTKHALAVTNRGDATAAEVIELARAIRDGVLAEFSVTLEPEPVFLNIVW